MGRSLRDDISFLMLQSKLPQTQGLKTTLIYYLSVSVSQRCWHGLSGSSAPGSLFTG